MLCLPILESETSRPFNETRDDLLERLKSGSLFIPVKAMTVCFSLWYFGQKCQWGGQKLDGFGIETILKMDRNVAHCAMPRTAQRHYLDGEDGHRARVEPSSRELLGLSRAHRQKACAPLRTRSAMLKGGKSDLPVVPGKPAEKPSVKRVYRAGDASADCRSIPVRGLTDASWRKSTQWIAVRGARRRRKGRWNSLPSTIPLFTDKDARVLGNAPRRELSQFADVHAKTRVRNRSMRSPRSSKPRARALPTKRIRRTLMLRPYLDSPRSCHHTSEEAQLNLARFRSRSVQHLIYAC